mmetsp:Transcript_16470/g.45156  ORF Transcript_16470/g.45156 Transcript_16470/m.45156 type:complete len:83 (+) Transcript_16470:1266-1514(+)
MLVLRIPAAIPVALSARPVPIVQKFVQELELLLLLLLLLNPTGQMVQGEVVPAMGKKLAPLAEPQRLQTGEEVVWGRAGGTL